ncbi:RNA polymerase sigma factor [Paracandidimonas lactea]|uniref:RNA polymerase sigma factor n=1 Tax=Paracandidimonas lactea TaxID=2895524 RepID=UPI001F44D1EC|nr:sigma-70 family RNA polymerase sigma factor [Paracandidimonas lactea]
MWDLHILFQRHAREINHYLRKCGHGDDDAADLTQDVFVKVLHAAPPACVCNPRAYLYAVARNLSTDVHRRRRIVQIAPVAHDSLGDIPDPTPDPERVAAGRQQLAAMRKALLSLPEQTRRAFELYSFRDMTIAEVAGELGLSVTRTWVLIQRACTHLRSVRHRAISPITQNQ